MSGYEPDPSIKAEPIKKPYNGKPKHAKARKGNQTPDKKGFTGWKNKKRKPRRPAQSQQA